MVKHIFLLMVLALTLSAQIVAEKASQFVAPSKAQSSKNLISFLFAQEEKYFNDNGINVISVLKTLKDNNLLELSYKEPQELELVFITRQNPLIFMRVVTESLNSMGYNFFLTKKIVKSPDEFVWSVTLSTQNVPNPILLADEFRARGCGILDISKVDNTWSYAVDSQYAAIDTIDIEPRRKTELKKPFEPYLLSIEGGVRQVTIEAHSADHWYPKVSFYDSSLRLIKIENIDRRKSTLRLEVPQNSAYMKIDDRYTLNNIIRGLKVTLE